MAYDTLIQGAHVARSILSTLSDRPISVSNTPYVIASLRGLHSIARRMRAISPDLRVEDRSDCLLFAHMLDEIVRLPNISRLAAIRRYIDDDLPQYSKVLHAPFGFREAGPQLLQGRRYSRMLVMVGPGIGIGDEVNFISFFRTLQETLGVPPDATEIYTFSRPLWLAVAPGVKSVELSRNPLRFFDRIRRCLTEVPPGEVFIAFASFMGQEMLRCFLPYRGYLDCMEVALASGQAWLQLRDTEFGSSHKAVNQTTRNMSRALDELLAFLLGRRHFTAVKRSTLSYRSVSPSLFRVFVNPFTSKFSPLTPEHWAQFIRDVRRALPEGTRLSGRICPGLSASCRTYASEIVRATERLELADVQLDILGRETGLDFGAENGIPEVYKALSKADLVLAVDTYTAHLAAHLKVISLALCLNRNPEFWQPAVNTFWVDINKGYNAVSAMIRIVTKLVTQDQSRSKVMDRYIAECRRLLALGHPLDFSSSNGNGSSGRISEWMAAAEGVWKSLPVQMPAVLDAVDSDHSWPRVAADLHSGNPETARASLGKMADSSFFRLACLAAADGRTRGF